MHAGFLDMFHDAGHKHISAVGKSIDIHFDCIAQIAVDQHRAVARDDHRFRDIAVELGLIMDDFHRPSAQHVGGADDDRKADFPGNRLCLFRTAGDAVARLGQLQLFDERLEAVAVFSQVNGIGGGAENGHIFPLQRSRQLERRLSAKLDDDALERAPGLFRAHDFQHILFRKRFEIEPVGGVVIGGDGFGIAVDHDGLEACIGQ